MKDNTEWKKSWVIESKSRKSGKKGKWRKKERKKYNITQRKVKEGEMKKEKER